MARTAGSTADQTEARVSFAAVRLGYGFEPTVVVSQLVAEFAITERTAQRYCKAAKEQYDNVVFTFDPAAEHVAGFYRQKRRAAEAELMGDTDLARKCDTDAMRIATQIQRLDPLLNAQAVSRATAVAVAEPNCPPSERKRRQYRQSIDDLPDDYPH